MTDAKGNVLLGMQKYIYILKGDRTFEQMAKDCGLSRTAVQLYRKGKMFPTSASMQKILHGSKKQLLAYDKANNTKLVAEIATLYQWRR